MIHIDVRIIAITNKSLEQMVKQEIFVRIYTIV